MSADSKPGLSESDKQQLAQILEDNRSGKFGGGGTRPSPEDVASTETVLLLTDFDRARYHAATPDGESACGIDANPGRRFVPRKRENIRDEHDCCRYCRNVFDDLSNGPDPHGGSDIEDSGGDTR